MMENFYASKVSRYIISLIYPALILVQGAKMFGIQLNMLLHIPLLLLLVFFGVKKIGLLRKSGCSKEIDLFLLYLGYVCLSGIWYLVNGLPLDVFTSSFTTYIFPMFFFLWGADIRDTSDNFYKIFFLSILLTTGMGLVLHYTTPSFYVSYMYEVKQAGVMASEYVTEETIMESKRFSGIFQSSYTISYLGTCAMLIALTGLLNNRFILNNAIKILAVLVLVVALILCLQRIASAMTFFFLLLFMYLGYKYKTPSLRFMSVVVILMLILIPTLTLSLSDRGDIILTLLKERMQEMNFKEAMAGRTGQYANVDFFSLDKIFGLGIGSASTYAIDHYNVQGVTDGEYPKQIMELGYVGLLFLFVLVVKSVRKAKFNYRCFSLELCVILYYLVAGIGHNSLTTYYTVYFFWFCLGRLNNTAYRNRLISERSLLCQK